MAERLDEEARRGVADHDPMYVEVVLPSEMARADALLKLGRSRDALETLTRIRATMERDYALSRARSTFDTMMSRALTNLGRGEEAVRFAADAVETSRFFDGPHAVETLDAMFVRGQTLAKIGRVEEAQETLRHVLAARTRILGPAHVHTRRTQDALRRIDAL